MSGGLMRGVTGGDFGQHELTISRIAAVAQTVESRQTDGMTGLKHELGSVAGGWIEQLWYAQHW